MSEYGSGISMGDAFSMDKERIKHALNGEIMVGEEEGGFIYDKASKKECDDFILHAFDNAVYWALKMCLDSNIFADMVEKFKRKEITENDILVEYLDKEHERGMEIYEDYEFESDRENLKDTFTVLKGGDNND